ncbi:MAG TPA: hypothetical protein PKL97_00320 [Candidatus Omnitrophota bacterium]|mgnify:CR=1 FL=1|nr:hypothetical protein [Candidatus Omnitrophota bacterium]
MSPKTHQTQSRKVISMGIELETYSIALPDYRICRDLQFPKRATVEKGEKFTKDVSVGSEYNSKVFKTIREAFFLLKSSLRKYGEFPEDSDANERYVIFPAGGWTDRFAGCHVHLATGTSSFKYEDAKKLSAYLHDHIPFLIVLGNNSPVWREKLTPYASTRLLRGSETYCRVIKRATLYKHHYREITYNQGGKKKPPTLEVRVCDSSIPEYVAAILTVCLAVAIRWQKRRSPLNQSTHENFLKARNSAFKMGTKAKLAWTNHWLSVPDYTDLFFRKYKEELDQMDIPEEVLSVFKYLKKGWDQSEVIRKAVERCQRKHFPTWQRQFAKKYSLAIEELLDGNSYRQFAHRLGVKLPSIERTWLGKKDSRW